MSAIGLMSLPANRKTLFTVHCTFSHSTQFSKLVCAVTFPFSSLDCLLIAFFTPVHYASVLHPGALCLCSPPRCTMPLFFTPVHYASVLHPGALCLCSLIPLHLTMQPAEAGSWQLAAVCSNHFLPHAHYSCSNVL